MKNILKIASICILMINLSSCQKDTLVTDVPHNQTPDLGWGQGVDVPIVKPYFFVGKVDSVLYTLQDSLDDYYNLAYDTLIRQESDTNEWYAQACGMYQAAGVPSLDIKFINLVDSTSQSGLDSLIAIGAMPYGSSNPLAPVSGVEITWVDNSGKVWQTLPGSGSAYNDSFVISSIMPAPTDSVGNKVITGTMNVTLFNATQYIPIEGGEFILQYEVTD